MNILITGVAGFIGSFATRELLKRGDNVVGIDNFSDYYAREAKEFNLDLTRLSIDEKSQVSSFEEVEKIWNLLQSFSLNFEDKKEATKVGFGKFTFIETDVRDVDAMKKLFSENKFDKILHLAAAAGVQYSIENPMLYSTSNVDGTICLLELAARNSVPKFVFASSSSVYGDAKVVPTKEDYNVDKPWSIYAATKRMGELACYTYNHIYKMNTLCARIFGPIYGPLQRPYGMAAQKFIRQIDQSKPITIYGDGSMKRDCTYIDDEVAGLIKCLDADMSKWDSEEIGYEIINVGGTGNPVSVKEMADLTIKYMDKGSVEYKELPLTEVSITCADISKAKRLLYYEAKMPYEEGIRRQIEVYKAMPQWYKELRI